MMARRVTMTTRSTETEKYGERYWCIKTPISKDGEIYAWADEVRIQANGELLLVWREKRKPPIATLGIAPGKWTVYYAASVLDGSAVAVEHWAGELNEVR